MTFAFDASDIHLGNPQPAGQPFRIEYAVSNNGPDDPGHMDHVDVWDIHSTKVVDQDVDAPASQSGGRYGCFVDIPALAEGQYDVAIAVAQGAASAGGTLVVR